MRRFVSVLALVALVGSALGCGATRGARGGGESQGFLGDYEDLLEEQSDEGAKFRYVRQGVDWASYDKALVDPVQFWRSANVDDGISPEESQILANYMYLALRRELGQDYTLVDSPQANTLRLSAVLTRAGKRNATLDTVSTVVPQLRLTTEAQAMLTGKPSFVGQASFEGKLSDAASGQVLGAALDTRVGGKTLKNMDSWSDVKSAIDFWASSLRKRLCRASNRTNCD